MSEKDLNPLDYMPASLIERHLGTDIRDHQERLKELLQRQRAAKPTWPAGDAELRREQARSLLARSRGAKLPHGLTLEDAEVALHEAASNFLYALNKADEPGTVRDCCDELGNVSAALSTILSRVDRFPIIARSRIDYIVQEETGGSLDRALVMLSQFRDCIDHVSSYLTTNFVSTAPRKMWEAWNGSPQLLLTQESCAIHVRLFPGREVMSRVVV